MCWALVEYIHPGVCDHMINKSRKSERVQVMYFILAVVVVATNVSSMHSIT